MKIRNLTFSLILMLSAFLFSGLTYAQKEARVIEIKGQNNMTYDKTEIVVKPGERITIRLTTVTDYKPRQMSHNWVLLKQTADVQSFVAASEKSAIEDFVAPNMRDQVYAYTSMAAGGETVEVTFTAPERPSKYMYVCTFPGHFFAGMMGTLTVKE
ncbi:MAG TPA: plastocyanin/azurin family copper-binding protein [Flavobacteriaceae bacterium]|nr:plastocyanin/azurin family copper-binding protein [Flavobacteriaceae bacterium]